ncbi:MAG: hypothetical protein ACI9IT_000517 [Glaciecola sp.]|jgi:hypothetical protein
MMQIKQCVQKIKITKILGVVIDEFDEVVK